VKQGLRKNLPPVKRENKRNRIRWNAFRSALKSRPVFYFLRPKLARGVDKKRKKKTHKKGSAVTRKGAEEKKGTDGGGRRGVASLMGEVLYPPPCPSDAREHRIETLNAGGR